MSRHVDDEKKFADEYNTSIGPAGGVHDGYNNGGCNNGDAAPAYGEHPEPVVGLKRQLKSRHIAMISIGGVM